MRGTSRGGLRRFFRKLTGIAGTLKKSWVKVSLVKRGRGVGPIQLDRMPDEILAIADLSSSLRCSSCTYAAVTSLEFYTHLLHRSERVSGKDAAFESRETVQAEEVFPHVRLPGNPRCATQHRKPRAVVEFDNGHLSEVFPEVIARFDVPTQTAAKRSATNADATVAACSDVSSTGSGLQSLSDATATTAACLAVTAMISGL